MEGICAPFPHTPGMLQRTDTAGCLPLVFVWQLATRPLGEGTGFMVIYTEHGFIRCQRIATPETDTVPTNPEFVDTKPIESVEDVDAPEEDEDDNTTT